MRFRIEGPVFERFPELSIGVVVACGIDNHGTKEMVRAFREAQIARVREAWSHARLDADPRVTVWREAYRAFGARPKKHRSSVENLIRTVLDGRSFTSINPAVDLYNAISLKHEIPAGGDDLDCVCGDIRLTMATGDERFVPLNGRESVSPRQGEVVYRDDEDVLCRRWNWRECEKSKLTEASTNLCLVVEGLPPVSADPVRRIATELADGIEGACGGRTSVRIVDGTMPEIDLR